MKQMEHYRMYAEVFGIDVPLIQSPPSDSTQGTHRTPSAPRSPTPKVDAVESSVPTRSTVIRLHLPQQKSTCLTPHAPVLTVDKAGELILQDTIQVSLAKHKKHVVDDSSIPRNDKHNIPGTRLEPRSDKESPKVGITDVIVLVNVYDEVEEEDEITDEVYELKRNEKRKKVEESRITPFSTPIRSPRINTGLVSSDTEKLYELTELQGRYGYLFEHLRAKFMPRKSFVTLPDHLHEAMADSLATMIDKHIKEQVETQVPEQVRNQVPVYVAEGLILERQKTKEEMEKMIAKDIHKRENSTKRQKTSEYEAYVSRESSSDQYNKQEQGPSTSGNQEKADNYDFWTHSYASSDDEIPTKQVSQDIKEEVLLNVDKVKLKKITDEMLRQRCTSVVFNDDDIKERASIWVNKKQKEPGKPKEVIYSNSKIVHVIKTYCELDHEHKFITEIIARRANDCIVSITEPDFKNLNKNDIEDMYLLIMNGNVPDYAETGLL
uniref:Uncharacterized protein n=1 Tax=Tanacetum cinerariifolium TaxID=118510 RepID=A0A6L2J7R9_TANCI|nr:hypothetical protein [Tanacetum cinerariifolium]